MSVSGLLLRISGSLILSHVYLYTNVLPEAATEGEARGATRAHVLIYAREKIYRGCRVGLLINTHMCTYLRL